MNAAIESSSRSDKRDEKAAFKVTRTYIERGGEGQQRGQSAGTSGLKTGERGGRVPQCGSTFLENPFPASRRELREIFALLCTTLPSRTGEVDGITESCPVMPYVENEPT